jgi:hypothetical protein
LQTARPTNVRTVTLFRYDKQRRRLWIAGQRCHHGATGALMALAGLVLMLHDRHDLTRWFARGWQSTD